MKAILFDLDGTLLDTAPDLAFALNIIRKQYNLPALPVAEIRSHINLGARGMIQQALGLAANDPQLEQLRQEFLLIYQDHLADATQFFPDIEIVLTTLDEHNIPWGIVTNKFTHYTNLLLQALKYDHRPKCVVCGDTLAKPKPDPEPIRHACQLLAHQPHDVIFVGDSINDVLAAKAAGAQALVALYGYIGNEDPYAWPADGYVQKPLQLLNWLN